MRASDTFYLCILLKNSTRIKLPGTDWDRALRLHGHTGWSSASVIRKHFRNHPLQEQLLELADTHPRGEWYIDLKTKRSEKPTLK